MSAQAMKHEVVGVTVGWISAIAGLDSLSSRSLQPGELSACSHFDAKPSLTLRDGPRGAEEDAMERYTFEPIREYAIITFRYGVFVSCQCQFTMLLAPRGEHLQVLAN